MDSGLSKEALAHLEVIAQVTIHLRFLGYQATSSKNSSLFSLFKRSNSLDSQLVADLMDAIHNTPAQISQPFCSTEEYIKLYYRSFDQKYPNSISLETIFKNYTGE
ncbi:hypothetical protein [Pseudoalteromonas luteoviolacea]|uniref:Uncharacterized protein n=1 Tax=Pseudoalteromonas luteoviolacea (strain 2ta16) TaxID=1353533 RepID=V4H247_PSEL2|nr:hypothetical protein [Pseudoalteromonas luteoviolacea]ESP91516.1 hypothetical protein PL2TA16_00315 [Pseudoalteromonas luteoviolacea 2ta16]KZN40166.1 hypothetical protein N483_18425 [Pseudoalteromonas luteoviolacea NCIMB 1944]